MATTIDMSALRTAAVAVFSGDSWLGSEEPVRVVTFEGGLREDVTEERRLTFGYGDAELPALVVESGVKFDSPVRVSGDTHGEDENLIPMICFIIDRKSKESSARDSVEQIREQAERVVKKQITATAKWGGYGPTLKPSVRSGISIIQDGKKHIAIAEITWDLLHFTTIEGV